MISRLNTASFWFYTRFLAAFSWFCSKVQTKEKHLDLLMYTAHMHTNLGRMAMIHAIRFAIENDVEVTDEPDDEDEDDKAAEGEEMNTPPDILEMDAEKSDEELPGFKGDDGNIIKPCFDPLPEYKVFEALFSAKYGKFGRCPIMILGKPHVFTCENLYATLDKISKDPKADKAARSLYGTVMAVVVQRYGHVVTPKQAN